MVDPLGIVMFWIVHHGEVSFQGVKMFGDLRGSKSDWRDSKLRTRQRQSICTISWLMSCGRKQRNCVAGHRLYRNPQVS